MLYSRIVLYKKYQHDVIALLPRIWNFSRDSNFESLKFFEALKFRGFEISRVKNFLRV